MAKNDNIEFGNFHRNIMGTLSFDMKLPNMRKAQDFIVYPASEKTDYITIQSDTRFGKIEMTTGRGLMSQSHANGAYAVHMHIDKLVKFQLTDSQLEKLKEELAKTAGSAVGRSVVISDNSYADKFAKGGKVDSEKVRKANEIYREHNIERKKRGIENFSSESAKLWEEGGYEDRLEKLNLNYEERNQLDPKKWYAKGGYVEEGEDYEYVNTFGIAQPDFEEIVEAWHKGNSLRNTDRINSRLVFRKMENKYGEDKIEEVSEYIMKTHEGHEHYAKGGEMGKLDAGVYRVGKPKKVSPYSYEQKIVEIFENGDISTASDYARKAADFHSLSKYPVISEKQLEAQYKYAEGGLTENSQDYFKHFDLNEEGNFAATIDGNKYEIIYRDDVSQLYDLFKNGKLDNSSRNLRGLMKFAKGGKVDSEKVRKANEIYREHNIERKKRGIENFSSESAKLWEEGGYEDRLEKLNLNYEERNQLDPKKWYAKGGYVEEGEDYEYVNTFKRFDSKVPVPQEDFEKFVDAYHKKLSGDMLDVVKYNNLKRNMGNYLGHKTMDEMEAYIDKTHKSHEHYAKGGGVDDDDYSYAKTRGLDSVDLEKEMKEFYGADWDKFTDYEKEILIEDNKKEAKRSMSFAKGGGVHNQFFVGQSIILSKDDIYFKRMTKDISNLVTPYYNTELVIEQIIKNKPYDYARAFVRASGEKVPFEIKLNPKYIKQYAKGGMFGAGHFASGGELVDKTIDHDGRYLHLVGNHRMLHIHLNNEGREMIMDERESGRGDEEIMYELFEDIVGNSTLMYHTDLGESGFGMTSSSGVTYDYGYDDNGDLVPSDDNAVVYVDNDSYRRSPVEELLEGRLIMRNSDFMARGGKLAGAGQFAKGGRSGKKHTMNGIVGTMENDDYSESVTIYGYDSHWDSHKPTAQEMKKTKQLLNEDTKILDDLGVKYKVDYEEGTNLPTITIKSISGKPATIESLQKVVSIKEELM